MKLEDLIAAGFSEEQATKIIEMHDASTEGLKSKKDELLDKLATTKQVKTESESELEKLRQYKETKDLEDAEAKKNYQEALDMVTARESKRANEIQAKLDAVSGNLRKLVVDNGLDAELDKAHVNPALKAAAKALLSSKLSVNDSGQAVTDEGQSISDLVGSWSQTDEGKAFVLASQNSGGGGQGSQGQGGKAAGGKKFSEMSGTERTELYRTDKAEYIRLREADKK